MVQDRMVFFQRIKGTRMFQFFNRLKHRKIPGKRLLIVNPASGDYSKISDHLSPDTGYLDPEEVDVYLTMGPGDAASRTRKALLENGATQILVAGGDGTISEVASGYFQDGKPLATKIPLGILRTGSANDFFRTIQTLSPNYEGAILENRWKMGDLCSVTLEPEGPSFPFINMASMGLSGEVISSMGRNGGRKSRLAFYYHSIRSLLLHPPREFALEWESEGMQRKLEGRFYNIFFGNGKSSGSGMLWAPQATPFDGKLEICLVGSSKIVLLLANPLIYRGRVRDIPGIDLFQTSHIRVTPRQSLLLDLDGELVPFDKNRYDSILVRVHPMAIPLNL